MNPIRRSLLAAMGAMALSGVVRAQSLPEIVVYKSPTCGCCNDWIKHLQQAGFSVQANDVGNLGGWRQRTGMPSKYASCHSAKVGNYAIEGHVPADDIKRMLRDKPDALGLAVPNMPIGSPGMDGPEYGGKRDAYAVLLVRRDGSAEVFARYEAIR